MLVNVSHRGTEVSPESVGVMDPAGITGPRGAPGFAGNDGAKVRIPSSMSS